MARGKDLQPEEIERLLAELGHELATRGFTSVQMMIVGGAYMLLNIGNRATTQDIDFFPLNFIDSSQPDQQTMAILRSINVIAKRNELKRDWCNDAAFGILGWTTPPFDQLTVWHVYEALEIYMPRAEFMLAIKLFGYRDRDFSDVQALLHLLTVETREQAQTIVDRYIDQKAQREYRTALTLDDLFEE